MKLLHVDSSILGQGSVSRTLSAEVVTAMRMRRPDTEVTYRDLAANPIGHLTAKHLAALRGAGESDLAIEPTSASDKSRFRSFLPLMSWWRARRCTTSAFPSQLKAWIDRLTIAGKTFRYTKHGPEGLAGGKKVTVVSSRGGFFGADTPTAAFDHQETYLRTMFGFLGVTNLSFVRAEGVALGATERQRAIASAKDQVTRLAA
jgi:FMN-dependent NADH-azoreductase